MGGVAPPGQAGQASSGRAIAARAGDPSQLGERIGGVLRRLHRVEQRPRSLVVTPESAQGPTGHQRVVRLVGERPGPLEVRQGEVGSTLAQVQITEPSMGQLMLELTRPRLPQDLPIEDCSSAEPARAGVLFGGVEPSTQAIVTHW